MRNLLLVVLFLSAFVNQALAAEIVGKHIPESKIVGEARMTYLFWDVYDASLHAPQGQWSEDKPFALTLHYLRSLNGEEIAERSADEMRKQGFSDEVKLAAWYSQMRDIFPNVQEGDKITGMYHPQKPTLFYLGDKKIGAIQDPEFGRWFFDIWLSKKTSEPQLRRQLLGLN